MFCFSSKALFFVVVVCGVVVVVVVVVVVLAIKECGILVLHPGLECGPPAVEAWGLNP